MVSHDLVGSGVIFPLPPHLWHFTVKYHATPKSFQLDYQSHLLLKSTQIRNHMDDKIFQWSHFSEVLYHNNTYYQQTLVVLQGVRDSLYPKVKTPHGAIPFSHGSSPHASSIYSLLKKHSSICSIYHCLWWEAPSYNASWISPISLWLFDDKRDFSSTHILSLF